MKRKQFLLSCMALCLALSTQAQVSDGIKKAFPAYVIYRVNGICASVSIPENEQWKIAQYYSRQDSLANKSLHEGADASSLDRYYGNDDRAIEKLLTPLEWNDYVCRGGNFASQSAAILTYRTQLGLTPDQTDTLLKITMRLPAMKAETGFNQKDFERKHIPEILNPGQLDKYQSIVNRKTAERNTAGDWKWICSMGLNTGVDSAAACSEFFNYELRLAAAYNDNFSNARNDDSVKAVNAQKPDLLIKGNIFKYQVPYSVLNEMVKFRDSLNLSETQENGLIQLAVAHERQRLQSVARDTSINTRTSDMLNIGKLLDKSQIDHYCVIVNRWYAAKMAKNDLDKLEKAGLLNGQDTAQVNAENFNYELGILVARDRIPFSDDKKTEFLLADARNNKPPLLEALDAKNKSAQATQQNKGILSW